MSERCLWYLIALLFLPAFWIIGKILISVFVVIFFSNY